MGTSSAAIRAGGTAQKQQSRERVRLDAAESVEDPPSHRFRPRQWLPPLRPPPCQRQHLQRHGTVHIDVPELGHCPAATRQDACRPGLTATAVVCAGRYRPEHVGSQHQPPRPPPPPRRPPSRHNRPRPRARRGTGHAGRHREPKPHPCAGSPPASFTATTAGLRATADLRILVQVRVETGFLTDRPAQQSYEMEHLTER